MGRILMKLIDLHAILSTLEDAEAEFEQLVYDKEWYVTDVIERIADSKERITSEIRIINND